MLPRREASLGAGAPLANLLVAAVWGPGPALLLKLLALSILEIGKTTTSLFEWPFAEMLCALTEPRRQFAAVTAAVSEVCRLISFLQHFIC